MANNGFKRLPISAFFSKEEYLGRIVKMAKVFRDREQFHLVLSGKRQDSKRNELAEKLEKIAKELETINSNPRLDDCINDLHCLIEEIDENSQYEVSVWMRRLKKGE